MINIATFISVLLLITIIITILVMDFAEHYVIKKINNSKLNKQKDNNKMDVEKRVRFADNPIVFHYEITREEIEMKQKTYREIADNITLTKITKQLKRLSLEPNRYF